MSAVWIVWDWDGDNPMISVHDSEAGARREAQRLAEDEHARLKERHEEGEAARAANAGAWHYATPDQLAPDWKPASPRPAPFSIPLARFERRVESYEVSAE